jgi:16S rRNA (guanine(1405)-N(7))-methyltransferase
MASSGLSSIQNWSLLSIKVEQVEIEAIVQEIKSSPKYRETSEETIRGLVEVEMGRHKKARQVVKAVRKRLHTIMAYYLGDADYQQSEAALRQAFEQGEPESIKHACRAILAEHPSTRERLEVIDAFYESIFAVTGKPKVLLDLACGLNPLTFPWMDLPLSLRYYAYDIHQPRIELLNAYFELQGLDPLAYEQDVIFHPPEEHGDVALILKELPRIDRNYQGAGLELLRSLQVNFVVVSFPVVSLHGGRDLEDHYRQYMDELLEMDTWSAIEIIFSNELVYCLKKLR